MATGQQVNSAGTRRSYLLFEVETHRCAMALEDVVEVLPMAALSVEPGGPSILAGFLNRGGTAIPVLHLSRLLAIADPPINAHVHLIIVSRGNERYGIIASRAIQVSTDKNLNVVSLPAMAVVKSAVEVGGEIVPIISIDELVLEQETRRLAEIQKDQQRRLRELEGSAA